MITIMFDPYITRLNRPNCNEETSSVENSIRLSGQETHLMHVAVLFSIPARIGDFNFTLGLELGRIAKQFIWVTSQIPPQCI